MPGIVRRPLARHHARPGMKGIVRKLDQSRWRLRDAALHDAAPLLVRL